MPGFALLMLQAAAATAAPPATPDQRLLLQPVPPTHCTGSSAEIVVCAKDQDAYRLHGAGPSIEPTLPAKAEWRLFGDTKMGVHGVERTLPGGVSAPAAMVTVTVPF
jgi:hypothetical protein